VQSTWAGWLEQWGQVKGIDSDLANINILTCIIDLRVVMVQDGVIGTSRGGDGIASVALLDCVGGLAVFCGSGAEAEDGTDGKICAGRIVFAGVEGRELEPGRGRVSKESVMEGGKLTWKRCFLERFCRSSHLL